MKTIHFKIKGLTCSACVKLASNRLKKILGVEVVDIDLDTGQVSLSYNGKMSIELLRQSLADTHYSIEEINI
ncbi:MAG: heavy metal-associated domain-containing protein [Patescibacteria group bacterium]|nr:heavy metal-associated domain-containing protein [Patescibacteria group bacterium]